MKAKRLSFETSKELKVIFNEQMEHWRRRERAGLEELATRCGVSPAYLAHVGRYGRIPSRPVLLLLALNFEMKDPMRLLTAAGSAGSWPYDPNIALAPRAAADQGLLSVKLDMAGFSAAIREIVRSEVKPRSVQELLRGRSLRVGLNPLKHWFFAPDFMERRDGKYEGYFSELCTMLALSLQCGLELKIVEYSDYPDYFVREELDIFGPIVAAPNLPAGTLFTAPLYRIGMSALGRTVPTSEIPTLPPPKTVQQMIEGPYQIAVIRNSRAHLLVNTRFKRSDSQVIICQSYEEALERIMFRGIRKAAHVFICNSVDAVNWHALHPAETIPLFVEPSTLLDFADSGIAVRADWPELVTAINEFTSFLERNGTLNELFYRWAPANSKGLLAPLSAELPSAARTVSKTGAKKKSNG